MPRGFSAIARTVKKFLEEHGYEIHIGAWVDIKIRGRLVFDFQIGHWIMHRPPRRGVPAALYLACEGRIPRRAREWLKGYDYLFCQSKWVRERLQEIDLDCIYMPVGIDLNHFKPMNMPKLVDVLYVAIWESSWDDRKFINKIHEIAFPHSYHAHTRPNVPYEQMPLLYNMARVYVCPSGCEGFNIAVVEANACGLPVVYNDCCATSENAYGIPVKPLRVYEKEDRGNLFLIHEPNVARMREELHKLLKDPKRLEQMSREARQHAMRYDYRRTYKPLLEVLPKPR